MEFKALIEKVLGEKGGLPGLEVTEVNEKVCTKPGDNYMSVVSLVEVTGRLPGGKILNTNVFIKRLPGNIGRKEDYQIDAAFSNEAVVYLQIFPLYELTVPCARCYYAQSDVILLQDLRLDGFIMGDRQKGFDLQTAEHILKALARFHAASYHASITKRSQFLETTSRLETFGLESSANKEMLETSLRRTMHIIEDTPDLKDIVPVIQRLQDDVCDVLRSLRRPSSIAVLAHGDFWINNIMVHLDSGDVRIVDLQACAVLSPAVDVWSFLYTSVESTIMDEHVDSLLQVYCKSFSAVLNTLNLDPNHILVADVLISELLSKELYGFLIATVYLPALDLSLESAENLESVTKERSLDDEFLLKLVGEGFKERLCSLVGLCKKRGVLK